MLSAFSQKELATHIKQVLGDRLSDQAVTDCIQALEIIEPPVAKQFWQAETAKPGIYIVLSGKVRLLDSSNDLINTLTPGASFGELTLFPEQDFSSYVARASVNLKIAYLPQATVKKIMGEFSSVYDLLLHKAELINPPKSPDISIIEAPKTVKSANFTQLVIPTVTQAKKRTKYFPIPTVIAGNWWRKFTKRYPFFEQQSAADCGAACLVMVGRYWGKNLSINKLRDLANISRSGASMRSLSAAAESLGFATRPVKASLDKFAQQSLPAIAHWQGKHYIVVYEITKKQVIIADPAIGQRQLSIQEFLAGWTGYALLLQPTASLKKTQEANTPFWQLLDLVKPHSQVLLEVFMASVLIQVFGLITPLFTQLLLDRVIVQGSVLTLNTVGFGLLIFGLFRVAINGLRQYLLDHTANRISVALMVGFIKHTFSLPLSFFESRYVGDIVSRVQENQKIQRFLTGEALSIGLDLLTVFIYVGLMFWYSPPMALMTLAIVPPFVLLTFFATPFLRRISREVFTAGTLENSYLIQSLTGISSIRSMAIEQTVRWHWEELLNNLIKKNFSGQLISNQLQLVSSTIQSLVSTGLLWFGAWLVIQNQLTIGQLVAFNMLLGNIIQPFQRLIILWNQLQEVIVATERINDVLEAQPEEDLEHQPRQFLPRLVGKISFNNVTFRYHPESEINILENLSFEILPEQTVAVVGRSGSGKTTLSKLILGLYLATDGKVLIDNQDVTSISLHSLRSQIGVVDQDTFLFGGTIRENITIAHPEASLEEIMEAAQLAGADEFIKRMPMGYETQIGEGGGMLSGGQRQRLAIARALLGNPRLLILDEATSHLDAESERIIQNNLKKILQGRTSVIIAHRLSTVRHADLILVLDRGVLVESGTHEELITKKGHYFYLNQQQLAQTN
ncbi:cysteine peptidase family C39 domain-containing protein [Dolichospermum sp. ST_con]|nr:cysteine peptidase family C39 domain-containing protein [Dolichospermum sp. ST_con]MDD1421206.1 cysteine peptidase family C39 domain-containing protein [Dolichospermum sp. ST_sed1]MDD1426656.1 cysteine peptidase family C39 domain-containing protein [Dolichospermum sp. ST_sed9]MDD1433265.1 cysteine peptidase family C39 domain-containing protein [Dolichospermum sp. ST_sed6]MDD1442788.1 cysteine peptidase family C39 domain-containing protein [Dolichospermum sp. ST_sed3]MDD1448229.1 cysteine pe